MAKFRNKLYTHMKRTADKPSDNSYYAGNNEPFEKCFGIFNYNINFFFQVFLTLPVLKSECHFDIRIFC